MTSIWLGARKSDRLMRANISINTDGITQPSVKPAPPDGGATVNRNNQSFVVTTISANPSARALSALVRTLRAVETKIELHGAGGLNHGHCTRSKLCVLLSQMAIWASQSWQDCQIPRTNSQRLQLSCGPLGTQNVYAFCGCCRISMITTR